MSMNANSYAATRALNLSLLPSLFFDSSFESATMTEQDDGKATDLPMENGLKFKWTICPALLQRAAEQDERIHILPPVRHSEAVTMMRSADIFLNLGNNNPRMTPSKIFEYMSFGKPIISTAPIADEPSLRYLERYPCSLVINQLQDVSEHVIKVQNFILENKCSKIDTSTLVNQFYFNTPDAFVACICDEE